MPSLLPRLNNSGLPLYHLSRIGPRATLPNVPDIMDLYRVTTVIGRNPLQADYVLDSSNRMRSAYISRLHARIIREGESHKLRDDSLNGIFVNHVKIFGSAILQEGDLVTFGHPNGSNIPAGTVRRQSDSEYQFLFTRCDCMPAPHGRDAEIIVCPSAEFQVPAPPSTTGRDHSEGSRHRRTQTQSFPKEDKGESAVVTYVCPSTDSVHTAALPQPPVDAETVHNPEQTVHITEPEELLIMDISDMEDKDQCAAGDCVTNELMHDASTDQSPVKSANKVNSKVLDSGEGDGAEIQENVSRDDMDVGSTSMDVDESQDSDVDYHCSDSIEYKAEFESCQDENVELSGREGTDTDVSVIVSSNSRTEEDGHSEAGMTDEAPIEVITISSESDRDDVGPELQEVTSEPVREQMEYFEVCGCDGEVVTEDYKIKAYHSKKHLIEHTDYDPSPVFKKPKLVSSESSDNTKNSNSPSVSPVFSTVVSKVKSESLVGQKTSTSRRKKRVKTWNFSAPIVVASPTYKFSDSSQESSQSSEEDDVPKQYVDDVMGTSSTRLVKDDVEESLESVIQEKDHIVQLEENGGDIKEYSKPFPQTGSTDETSSSKPVDLAGIETEKEIVGNDTDVSFQQDRSVSQESGHDGIEGTYTACRSPLHDAPECQKLEFDKGVGTDTVSSSQQSEGITEYDLTSSGHNVATDFIEQVLHHAKEALETLPDPSAKMDNLNVLGTEEAHADSGQTPEVNDFVKNTTDTVAGTGDKVQGALETIPVPNCAGDESHYAAEHPSSDQKEPCGEHDAPETEHHNCSEYRDLKDAYMTKKVLNHKKQNQNIMVSPTEITECNQHTAIKHQLSPKQSVFLQNDMQDDIVPEVQHSEEWQSSYNPVGSRDGSITQMSAEFDNKTEMNFKGSISLGDVVEKEADIVSEVLHLEKKGQLSDPDVDLIALSNAAVTTECDDNAHQQSPEENVCFEMEENAGLDVQHPEKQCQSFNPNGVDSSGGIVTEITSECNNETEMEQGNKQPVLLQNDVEKENDPAEDALHLEEECQSTNPNLVVSGDDIKSVITSECDSETEMEQEFKQTVPLQNDVEQELETVQEVLHLENECQSFNPDVVESSGEPKAEITSECDNDAKMEHGDKQTVLLQNGFGKKSGFVPEVMQPEKECRPVDPNVGLRGGSNTDITTSCNNDIEMEHQQSPKQSMFLENDVEEEDAIIPEVLNQEKECHSSKDIEMEHQQNTVQNTCISPQGEIEKEILHKEKECQSFGSSLSLSGGTNIPMIIECDKNNKTEDQQNTKETVTEQKIENKLNCLPEVPYKNKESQPINANFGHSLGESNTESDNDATKEQQESSKPNEFVQNNVGKDVDAFANIDAETIVEDSRLDGNHGLYKCSGVQERPDIPLPLLQVSDRPPSNTVDGVVQRKLTGTEEEFTEENTENKAESCVEVAEAEMNLSEIVIPDVQSGELNTQMPTVTASDVDITGGATAYIDQQDKSIHSYGAEPQISVKSSSSKDILKSSALPNSDQTTNQIQKISGVLDSPSSAGTDTETSNKCDAFTAIEVNCGSELQTADQSLSTCDNDNVTVCSSNTKVYSASSVVFIKEITMQEQEPAKSGEILPSMCTKIVGVQTGTCEQKVATNADCVSLQESVDTSSEGPGPLKDLEIHETDVSLLCVPDDGIENMEVDVQRSSSAIVESDRVDTQHAEVISESGYPVADSESLFLASQGFSITHGSLLSSSQQSENSLPSEDCVIRSTADKIHTSIDGSVQRIECAVADLLEMIVEKVDEEIHNQFDTKEDVENTEEEEAKTENTQEEMLQLVTHIQSETECSDRINSKTDYKEHTSMRMNKAVIAQKDTDMADVENKEYAENIDTENGTRENLIQVGEFRSGNSEAFEEMTEVRSEGGVDVIRSYLKESDCQDSESQEDMMADMEVCEESDSHGNKVVVSDTRGRHVTDRESLLMKEVKESEMEVTCDECYGPADRTTVETSEKISIHDEPVFETNNIEKEIADTEMYSDDNYVNTAENCCRDGTSSDVTNDFVKEQVQERVSEDIGNIAVPGCDDNSEAALETNLGVSLSECMPDIISGQPSVKEGGEDGSREEDSSAIQVSNFTITDDGMKQEHSLSFTHHSDMCYSGEGKEGLSEKKAMHIESEVGDSDNSGESDVTEQYELEAPHDVSEECAFSSDTLNEHQPKSLLKVHAGSCDSEDDELSPVIPHQAADDVEDTNRKQETSNTQGSHVVEDADYPDSSPDLHLYMSQAVDMSQCECGVHTPDHELDSFKDSPAELSLLSPSYNQDSTASDLQNDKEMKTDIIICGNSENSDHLGTQSSVSSFESTDTIQITKHEEFEKALNVEVKIQSEDTGTVKHVERYREKPEESDQYDKDMESLSQGTESRIFKSHSDKNEPLDETSIVDMDKEIDTVVISHETSGGRSNPDESLLISEMVETGISDKTLTLNEQDLTKDKNGTSPSFSMEINPVGVTVPCEMITSEQGMEKTLIEDGTSDEEDLVKKSHFKSAKSISQIYSGLKKDSKFIASTPKRPTSPDSSSVESLIVNLDDSSYQKNLSENSSTDQNEKTLILDNTDACGEDITKCHTGPETPEELSGTCFDDHKADVLKGHEGVFTTSPKAMKTAASLDENDFHLQLSGIESQTSDVESGMNFSLPQPESELEVCDTEDKILHKTPDDEHDKQGKGSPWKITTSEEEALLSDEDIKLELTTSDESQIIIDESFHESVENDSVILCSPVVKFCGLQVNKLERQPEHNDSAFIPSQQDDDIAISEVDTSTSQVNLLKVSSKVHEDDGNKSLTPDNFDFLDQSLNNDVHCSDESVVSDSELNMSGVTPLEESADECENFESENHHTVEVNTSGIVSPFKEVTDKCENSDMGLAQVDPPLKGKSYESPSEDVTDIGKNKRSNHEQEVMYTVEGASSLAAVAGRSTVYTTAQDDSKTGIADHKKIPDSVQGSELPDSFPTGAIELYRNPTDIEPTFTAVPLFRVDDNNMIIFEPSSRDSTDPNKQMVCGHHSKSCDDKVDENAHSTRTTVKLYNSPSDEVVVFTVKPALSAVTQVTQERVSDVMYNKEIKKCDVETSADSELMQTDKHTQNVKTLHSVSPDGDQRLQSLEPNLKELEVLRDQLGSPDDSRNKKITEQFLQSERDHLLSQETGDCVVDLPMEGDQQDQLDHSITVKSFDNLLNVDISDESVIKNYTGNPHCANDSSQGVVSVEDSSSCDTNNKCPKLSEINQNIKVDDILSHQSSEESQGEESNTLYNMEVMNYVDSDSEECVEIELKEEETRSSKSLEQENCTSSCKLPNSIKFQMSEETDGSAVKKHASDNRVSTEMSGCEDQLDSISGTCKIIIAKQTESEYETSREFDHEKYDESVELESGEDEQLMPKIEESWSLQPESRKRKASEDESVERKRPCVKDPERHVYFMKLVSIFFKIRGQIDHFKADSVDGNGGNSLVSPAGDKQIVTGINLPKLGSSECDMQCDIQTKMEKQNVVIKHKTGSLDSIQTVVKKEAEDNTDLSQSTFRALERSVKTEVEVKNETVENTATLTNADQENPDNSAEMIKEIPENNRSTEDSEKIRSVKINMSLKEEENCPVTCGKSVDNESESGSTNESVAINDRVSAKQSYDHAKVSLGIDEDVIVISDSETEVDTTHPKSSQPETSAPTAEKCSNGDKIILECKGRCVEDSFNSETEHEDYSCGKSTEASDTTGSFLDLALVSSEDYEVYTDENTSEFSNQDKRTSSRASSLSIDIQSTATTDPCAASSSTSMSTGDKSSLSASPGKCSETSGISVHTLDSEYDSDVYITECNFMPVRSDVKSEVISSDDENDDFDDRRNKKPLSKDKAASKTRSEYSHNVTKGKSSEMFGSSKSKQERKDDVDVYSDFTDAQPHEEQGFDKCKTVSCQAQQQSNCDLNKKEVISGQSSVHDMSICENMHDVEEETEKTYCLNVRETKNLACIEKTRFTDEITLDTDEQKETKKSLNKEVTAVNDVSDTKSRIENHKVQDNDSGKASPNEIDKNSSEVMSGSPETAIKIPSGPLPCDDLMDGKSPDEEVSNYLIENRFPGHNSGLLAICEVSSQDKQCPETDKSIQMDPTGAVLSIGDYPGLTQNESGKENTLVDVSVKTGPLSLSLDADFSEDTDSMCGTEMNVNDIIAGLEGDMTTESCNHRRSASLEDIFDTECSGEISESNRDQTVISSSQTTSSTATFAEQAHTVSVEKGSQNLFDYEGDKFMSKMSSTDSKNDSSEKALTEVVENTELDISEKRHKSSRLSVKRDSRSNSQDGISFFESRFKASAEQLLNIELPDKDLPFACKSLGRITPEARKDNVLTSPVCYGDQHQEAVSPKSSNNESFSAVSNSAEEDETAENFPMLSVCRKRMRPSKECSGVHAKRLCLENSNSGEDSNKSVALEGNDFESVVLDEIGLDAADISSFVSKENARPAAEDHPEHCMSGESGMSVLSLPDIEHSGNVGGVQESQTSGIKFKSVHTAVEDLSNSQLSQLDRRLAASKSPEKLRKRKLLEKIRARRKKQVEEPSLQQESQETPSLLRTPGDLPAACAAQRNIFSSEAQQSLKKIEGYIERCKSVTSLLNKAFQQSHELSSMPTVKIWREELEQMDKKVELPKTVIAVVGDTGCGKSSMLNALLEQPGVLPTSGIEACTAVVVEVVENTNNTKYEAEIHFLSQEEWDEELHVLLKDLTKLDGTLQKKQPDPQTEAGVAFAKVRAVYGKVDQQEVLQRTTHITRWLGKVRRISVNTARGLRDEVNKYIDSSDLGTKGGQYWPVIKKVQLSLPSCDVCSSGAILVDLPGVRDANAARDSIAREYLKNSTSVWVVAEIHRAKDNRTAKDLLDENFRRQLMMDGQFGSVAFICTKADSLIPSELRKLLPLPAEFDELNNEVRQLEGELSNLQQEKLSVQEERQITEADVRARKSEYDEVDTLVSELREELLLEEEDESQMQEMADMEKDLEEIDKVIKGKQMHIQELQSMCDEIQKKVTVKTAKRDRCHKNIALMCAKARNEHSKKMIKRGFRAGIRELKRKSVTVGEEEDIQDYDDGESDVDDGEETGDIINNLGVFCTSSTDYMKMRKLLAEGDGEPKVFSSPEETGIPALREFVHSTTLKRREHGARQIIENVGHFVFDIGNYLKMSECDNKESHQARNLISRHLKTDMSKRIEKIVVQLSEDLHKLFMTYLMPKLEEGSKVAAQKAKPTSDKWHGKVNKENRKMGGLHWNTYKAVVSRYGKYRSKAVGNIDFNEELAEPLLVPVSCDWDRVFSSLMWKILDKVKASMSTALQEFSDDIKKAFINMDFDLGQIDTVLSQMMRTANAKLNEMIDVMKEYITNQQREISRIVTPNVQVSLLKTYKEMNLETGVGSYSRMKNIMTAHLNTDCDRMFDDCVSEIKKQFADLQKNVCSKVKGVLQALCRSFEISFEPLWQSTSCSENIKKYLTESISQCLVLVQQLYRDIGLPVPISTAATEPDLDTSVTFESEETVEEVLGALRHDVEDQRRRLEAGSEDDDNSKMPHLVPYQLDSIKHELPPVPEPDDVYSLSIHKQETDVNTPHAPSLVMRSLLTGKRVVVKGVEVSPPKNSPSMPSLLPNKQPSNRVSISSDCSSPSCSTSQQHAFTSPSVPLAASGTRIHQSTSRSQRPDALPHTIFTSDVSNATPVTTSGQLQTSPSSPSAVEKDHRYVMEMPRTSPCFIKLAKGRPAAQGHHHSSIKATMPLQPKPTHSSQVTASKPTPSVSGGETITHASGTRGVHYQHKLGKHVIKLHKPPSKSAKQMKSTSRSGSVSSLVKTKENISCTHPPEQNQSTRTNFRNAQNCCASAAPHPGSHHPDGKRDSGRISKLSLNAKTMKRPLLTPNVTVQVKQEPEEGGSSKRRRFEEFELIDLTEDSDSQLDNRSDQDSSSSDDDLPAFL